MNVPGLRLARAARAVLAGVGALGALALANMAAARRIERRYPPQGQFVHVDGVRLRYLEQGAGPGVVLLHGNGAVAEDFVVSGLMGLLSERHRVIAFDRPGFGYSERPRDRVWTAQTQADLLRAASQRLGVSRPVLVGHSWGTIVALAMAQAQPGDTAGLVLLGGYYFPQERWDAWLVSLTGGPRMGRVLAATIWPVVVRLLMPFVVRTVFAPDSVPERFRREYPLLLALRPSHIAASVADTVVMDDSVAALAARCAALRVPTVILAGPGDRVVETALHARRLHEAVPGSELRLIEGAGHMVHYAAPEAVAAAVEEVGAGSTMTGSFAWIG